MLVNKPHGVTRLRGPILFSFILDINKDKIQACSTGINERIGTLQPESLIITARTKLHAGSLIMHLMHKKNTHLI